FFGPVVVLHDQYLRPPSGDTGIRRRGSPKRLEEAEQRALIHAIARLGRFLGAKRSISPDDPDHLLPRGISPVEPILRICHAAVVEVNFADEATTIARIVNRILPLDGVLDSPLKQILVSNLDLPAVPDKIKPEFRCTEVTLQSDPAVYVSLSLDHAG